MVHIVIKSDLKWCVHLLSRILFLYFNYLVSVTAGGPVSPRGHTKPSSTVDFGWFVVAVVVVVVVDCGLTSHSAIFQLYSDGTDVQFPNFDLLPGTHAMDS